MDFELACFRRVTQIALLSIGIEKFFFLSAFPLFLLTFLWKVWIWHQFLSIYSSFWEKIFHDFELKWKDEFYSLTPCVLLHKIKVVVVWSFVIIGSYAYFRDSFCHTKSIYLCAIKAKFLFKNANLKRSGPLSKREQL